MVSSDGSSYRLREDGSELTVANRLGTDSGDWWGDTSGIDNTTVGALEFNSSVIQYFDGAICEILCYDGVNLTQGEIDSIELYLSNKWGVALA